jgi:hypothetical protein
MPVLRSLHKPGAFVKNSFYYFYYIFDSLIMATSKRKKLTIAEKVKKLHEVEKNSSTPAIEIARKFNLAPSSLFCIMKNKQLILEKEVICGGESIKKTSNRHYMMKWRRY